MDSYEQEFADLAANDAEMRDMRAENETIRYKTTCALIVAIYNMAKAGEVHLPDIFGSKEQKVAVFKKLKPLIGYRFEDKGLGYQRVIVPECFDPNCVDPKLSAAARTIAIVTLTKAARVALHAIENNLEVSVVTDKAFPMSMAIKLTKRDDKPRFDNRIN
jgi:hypothetical protein